MAKIISNGKEIELGEYVLECMDKTDPTSIRDVDRSIDYFLNLVVPFSELITVLYEKKLLNVDDVRRVLKSQEINIID